VLVEDVIQPAHREAEVDARPLLIAEYGVQFRRIEPSTLREPVERLVVVRVRLLLVRRDQ
jgi:hypothetical protein